MRLWHNTTKRIAKKHMRHYWGKLQFGEKLKPGDLVSTCIGYNERIKQICPCWTRYGLSKGRFVFDFDIITEGGSCCSLIHCCTVPTETKEQIESFWLGFLGEEREEVRWKVDLIPGALARGEAVFDQNGEVLYEFCEDHVKALRFPERWLNEHGSSSD